MANKDEKRLEEIINAVKPEAEKPAPSSPSAPAAGTTNDILERLLVLMEGRAASAVRAPDADTSVIMEKLTTAFERFASAQIESGQTIAAETRRAHRPSNEIVPMNSVFNRRGEFIKAKPPLKCLMMVPWLIEWESINREECELLNLLEKGEFTVRRADRSPIKVVVKIEYGIDDVTPSRLTISHPTAFNNDNFKLMPPLSDFLRSILNASSPKARAAAKLIMTDEEEEMLIASGELSISA